MIFDTPRWLKQSLFIALGFTSIARCEETPRPTRFDQLSTKSGQTYQDCTVTRHDSEGLIIEHKKGMARISFFDLDQEIQEQYDFDPVIAIRDYRKFIEADRRRRKRITYEIAKNAAETERRNTYADLQQHAKRDWIPVKATILFVDGNTIWAHVRKITFQATEETSALGFKRPGPKKRVLRPFSDQPLYLQIVADPDTSGLRLSPHATWEGYIEPASRDTKPHPTEKEKSEPVHLAVSPP